MIVLSLLLMLGSLCLLVVGLLDGVLALMIGAVVASVAAGAVLYLAARRRRVLPDGAGSAAGTAVGIPADTGPQPPVAEEWRPPAEQPQQQQWQPPADQPQQHWQPPAGQPQAGQPQQQWPPPPPPDEPPEEQVAPDDAAWIARQHDAVVVIDGRPRYHRFSCTHLIGRSTVPLTVADARDAGFTPCALCRPDADLLGRR